MRDLDVYAQNNGILLIDFAHDQRLASGDFKDMHHLNQGGREIFTEMLVEALQSVALP
jgi:hypothetical protein